MMPKRRAPKMAAEAVYEIMSRLNVDPDKGRVHMAALCLSWLDQYRTADEVREGVRMFLESWIQPRLEMLGHYLEGRIDSFEMRQHLGRKP
jgi:hypothetical protein